MDEIKGPFCHSPFRDIQLMINHWVSLFYPNGRILCTYHDHQTNQNQVFNKPVPLLASIQHL